MHYYVMITPDGATIQMQREEELDLLEMQNLVKGYIEEVPRSLYSDSRVLSIFVNEEGLILGEPANIYASELFNCHTVLHGNVLIEFIDPVQEME